MICSYNCPNKTEHGYCKTTGCIYPEYRNSVTINYEPPSYKIIQYAELSDESIDRIVEAFVKKLKEVDKQL